MAGVGGVLGVVVVDGLRCQLGFFVCPVDVLELWDFEIRHFEFANVLAPPAQRDAHGLLPRLRLPRECIGLRSRFGSFGPVERHIWQVGPLEVVGAMAGVGGVLGVVVVDGLRCQSRLFVCPVDVVRLG